MGKLKVLLLTYSDIAYLLVEGGKFAFMWNTELSIKVAIHKGKANRNVEDMDALIHDILEDSEETIPLELDGKYDFYDQAILDKVIEHLSDENTSSKQYDLVHFTGVDQEFDFIQAINRLLINTKAA